jgi:hypothetical protein
MQLHSRRSFMRLLALLLVGSLYPDSSASLPAPNFSGAEVLDRLLRKARAEKWKDLPIGELMGRVAMQFEGTPYEAGTLDVSKNAEVCTVNLLGLDCITFVETTLDLARMIKQGKGTREALLDQVQFTRYRGGKQGDYSSRLHYTTEWLIDNQRRGVLKILTTLPGAEPFHPAINFMSTHAQLYPQLVANPTLVDKLKRAEERINSSKLTYIPAAKIAAVEPFLQTGDIVGLCSRVPGLDIDHTGLIIRKDGVAHFMDASSRKQSMKVVLEPGPLHAMTAKSDKIMGAIFARALP